MGSPRAGSAPEPPYFFLQRTPDQGPPELSEGDRAHALRVLRLRAGDWIVGLDGAGSAWTLEVQAAGRRELRLGSVGAPRRVPGPGEPGAPLPWIEVAAAWPRGSRGDAMVASLTALGAAAVAPLDARHSGPGDPRRAAERGRRVARETCKQARRLWLPELREVRTPGELVREHSAAALALLEPGSEQRLVDWLRGLAPPKGTREVPIVLAVGPEGGFDPAERAALVAAGATPLTIGPHVLRIELAAEAALAVAAAVLHRTGES